MDLLNPPHPPPRLSAQDCLNGFTPPSSFNSGIQREEASHLPGIVEEGSGKVHVAVGKSEDKAASLLQWAFNQFRGKEICILHVHQPSSVIPTLLGKLPASQANAQVVFAHRREEREQMLKLLENYMSICCAAKAKASIVMVEAEQVQKGIVDLVNRHTIRKLVMGAVPENCMKVKKNSRKANYAAKNAPLFCEIWFINKGKHVWTREASEDPCCLPLCTQPQIETVESLRCLSFQYGKNKTFHSESLRASSARTIMCTGSSNWVQDGILVTEIASLPPLSHSSSRNTPQNSTEREGYLDSNLKTEEESLKHQLFEAKIEAETATNKVLAELLKRKRLESEAMEAIIQANAFESAHVHEAKLVKEAEHALKTTVEEQEKLLDEKRKVTKELQRVLRNISLLDSRAQEANSRREEVAGELSLIQASIATLWQEMQQIRRQKMEALCWLERWKTRRQVEAANCSGFIGFMDELPELAEFSLSDIKNATCNFSETFRIGQGGYGDVYKGEMLGRTVAIRKLHPHKLQGPPEFYQEVQVLGSLQHPHLVTLLGVCPEAWCLVYEYLPNGSLENHLSQKSNIPHLKWSDRARIITEIASALCFLHSSRPESIVHGDLKPQNILLDSDFGCKICDFGISRLVNEDTLHCPSFRRSTEPKGAFTYTDPQFQRTGMLTPKSDIYSFGLIILQLLTGRSPVGLASEVCRAISCGKLSSILDYSAGEWPPSVATRLVEIGLKCCESNGRDRPDIKPTLVKELEELRVSEERPVPSFFLCPVFQEIMHDPLIAADGYTYEGEAIREWLESGHETSPMTNLKLSHTNLTPNHALWLAIQDWLCKSLNSKTVFR